jgi:hypothetical protein
MPTRQQLHEAIERLPDFGIPAALRYIEFLSVDPALYSLLTAPLDDEAYTPEQQQRDVEADAAIERGEGIPPEEVAREFGLS